MKKRIGALILALTLVLSLCAVSALADEQKAEQQASSETGEGSGEGEQPSGAEAVETAEDAETTEPVSLAGPDGDTETEYVPDALGQVSFANLERRMRENNLNLLALQENRTAVENMDYEKLSDYLRDQMNELSDYMWGMTIGGGGETYTYAMMKQSYDAMDEQFEAIKDGELQKDNAGVAHQLQNLQDQIIMGGESMYVALNSMELQEKDLQRQLTALNRTVEEMRLRYQMGQISALQLQQTEAGRTSLVSGLETLRMNIQNYKTHLELMLGAELTGEITLGAVPAVRAEQLEGMDLEKDLALAKERSYELYAAEQNLKDAKEKFNDKGELYNYNEKNPLYIAEKHGWKAAQYTYDAAVQDYELRFRVLYAQVGDYAQILEAAKVSLACEQSACAAAKMKYEQGTISKNELLKAEDSLSTAEGKVESASTDLFTAYNNYRWAVERGILN